MRVQVLGQLRSWITLFILLSTRVPFEWILVTDLSMRALISVVFFLPVASRVLCVLKRAYKTRISALSVALPCAFQKIVVFMIWAVYKTAPRCYDFVHAHQFMVYSRLNTH